MKMLVFSALMSTSIMANASVLNEMLVSEMDKNITISEIETELVSINKAIIESIVADFDTKIVFKIKDEKKSSMFNRMKEAVTD